MVTKLFPLVCLGGLIAALGTGAGCAGRVEVTGARGEVLVSFKSGRDEKVPVSSIAVFEVTGGKRGRSVCEVVTPSLDAVVELTAWRYGTRIDSYEIPVTCERLVPETRYGVLVTWERGGNQT
jgi:hypothetical protein